ncbi:hypothetical protein SPRG_15750 [Saprolegnia parasitica CBS 223.65]|uniref:Uncharacterized protein n=1 Tax=Saprolegnia parasitica (strain CBS 223.65) TaxID=695850 RepID=A0A067BXE9_SAPPC|nr:hypothetical protein SPRG_15750 [Saprolegnia parasitica CBS 223.65]KDO19001.1 hypothetical protein SPRG_15750 [Saprolegnia parasitica CBS 223.65]|eukprot:XP_012210288.1 hypothetical protein SPRG_15750 [Saprolegnia parasitica CBS 223.65]
MARVQLQLKKRKRPDARTVEAAPCFLSQSQLEAMTEYEYADAQASSAPPVALPSLEDVAHKVKRLQDEGNVLAEAERYRAAMERWHQAIEYDPTHAVLHELLAQAHLALGEFFQGIQVATRATELAPTWADAHMTLARCQFNYGELDLALASLQTAVTLVTDPMELAALLDEAQDMARLRAERDAVLAQSGALLTTLTRPDDVQVAECKMNLARRINY